jgi:hypothetical protein
MDMGSPTLDELIDVALRDGRVPGQDLINVLVIASAETLYSMLHDSWSESLVGLKMGEAKWI